MQIIIMGCSGKGLWYKNSIGKTFTVVQEDSEYFNVKTKKELAAVMKKDAEVTEK